MAWIIIKNNLSFNTTENKLLQSLAQQFPCNFKDIFIKHFKSKKMRIKNRRRNNLLLSRRGKPQATKAELMRPDNLSDISDENYSHGYHNPDYSRNNFWPDYMDQEDRGYNGYEPTGYIESEHFEPEHPMNRAVGFGNENSQFVEDFNRMKSRSEQWYREGLHPRKLQEQQNENRYDPNRPEYFGPFGKPHDFYDEEAIDDELWREYPRLKRPNIRDKWSEG